MNAAVSFRRVSRSFGSTRALDDVSFEVPLNSVCALLGPNGAGKTTAIRILLGLARAHAGEISVLGERPGSRAARYRLGYLPDVPTYPAWMTAREYMEASARLAGVPASQADQRIDSLLDLADLSSTSQRIGGYSRGMRQRLGLAQALVGAPELLVLDEPTSALDPAGHREVLDLVERLSGQTTILLSSHNLAEVDRVATHAVVLRSGKALASSQVADLRRKTGLLRLVLRSNGGQALQTRLSREPWCSGAGREGRDIVLLVSDLEAASRAVPAIVAGGGWSLTALVPEEQSLEDVFLALTREGGEPADGLRGPRPHAHGRNGGKR